jgi:hypothetical protein
MAQIDAAAQQSIVDASAGHAKYGQPVDRESAYERLAAKLAVPPTDVKTPAGSDAMPPAAPAPGAKARRSEHERQPKAEPSVVDSVLKSSAFKSFTRSAGTALAREITRGIFGTRRR